MSAQSRDGMLRAARNQTLHREVNERIKELNQRFDGVVGTDATWICECFDQTCTEQMELTLTEYDVLRTNPHRFAVVPGHVEESVELVVEDHEKYVVVEKVGPAARYVAEHDPRKPVEPTP